MKRGVITIVVILLLTIFVLAAPSVTLTSPSNGATEDSSITFTCSATDTNDITTLTLYTDTSGTWTSITSNTTSGTSMSLTHSISSVSDGSYNWNCKATNNQSQESFATSNYTLTVTSTTVTFTGTISNQTITEDTASSNAFDLDTYFSGATTYAVTGNSSINITIANDNQVSFSPSANFTGTETIRFSGTDGSSTNYSNYILLNVTPVNDPPHFTGNLTNITWTKNNNKSFSFSSYFTDVDGDSLNYSASTSSYINTTFSGATATFAPNTDWTGTESVTITATDGTYNATKAINLTVTSSTSSNNAPTIDAYTPDSDPTLEKDQTQEFTVNYSDSDNDTLSVTWYVGSSSVGSGNSYTYTASESGAYTIKAEVSDGTTTTTKSWTVTVTGTAIEEVSEEVSAESILGEQTQSAVCGNGIVEEGEDCSNCADAYCNKGFTCIDKTCVEKKGGKAILWFFIIIIAIIGISVGVYFYIQMKKQPPKKQDKKQPFKYKKQEEGERPPADYTDFYHK